MDSTSPMEAKNSSRSASDVDVAASLVTSGNGGNDTANLLSPNNSEEPLPLEPQPAPVLTQQQRLECDDDNIPVTMPSQITNKHTVSDDTHQPPLYSGNGGQAIPLGQLEMGETQTIVSFSTELSTDLHQQQNNPPDDPHTILSLAPTIDPVQESSHGQSGVTMLSTTCHADEDFNAVQSTDPVEAVDQNNRESLVAVLQSTYYSYHEEEPNDNFVGDFNYFVESPFSDPSDWNKTNRLDIFNYFPAENSSYINHPSDADTITNTNQINSEAQEATVSDDSSDSETEN